MKKILGEYSQILGYTFTGLVFGLSCFIIFLNFYHFKEVGTTVGKTNYTNDLYTKVQENINQTRTNASVYDINGYSGPENGYEMLSIQSRLMLCVDSFSDAEIKSFFEKDQLSLPEIYEFQSVYQRKVINGCIVKQLYDITSIEGSDIKFTSNKVKMIAPFVKLESAALIRRTEYVAKNIKNNSSYFFSNKDAKENVFDIAKDSYYEILLAYKDASEFLLEVSKWYYNVVGGRV